MIVSSSFSSDSELFEDCRAGLKASIDYFSAKNKAERERWVCHEFLRNLGVRYRLSEVTSPAEDPPDACFRSANFEIKEVLDAGRRRHAEYKESYKRALAATTSNELVNLFDPKDLTASEVFNKVEGVLENCSSHYPAQLRGSLDLLVYVNLSNHFFKNSPMPVFSGLARYGWRSVSALAGWQALVFHAERGAPRVLALRRGTCSQRRYK
jgi:Putative endonuclease, protein of unknown function (DUF1780)